MTMVNHSSTWDILNELIVNMVEELTDGWWFIHGWLIATLKTDGWYGWFMVVLKTWSVDGW